MERTKANIDSLKAYHSIMELASKSNKKSQEVLYNILRFDILAHLFSIFKNDSLSVLNEYIKIYRDMGMYPCEKTASRRANLFRIIINRPWLIKIMKVLPQSYLRRL